MIRGFLYRILMRIAHRYHWHHAPLIGPISPDQGYQRWCKWCGMRQGYSYDPRKPLSGPIRLNSGSGQTGNKAAAPELPVLDGK